MFNTLEASLGTKAAVIISSKDYTFKGLNRKSIMARKANGKKVFNVVLYESGKFSSAA